MGNWSAAEWLALGALVVAILGIPLTIWATRRWGERRSRLLFTYRSVPLLPSGDHQLLKVTYRDLDVPEPHLVALRLRNVGPRDIASGHFDGGRPLEVKLLSKLYGLVETSPQGRFTVQVPSAGTEDGYVNFNPGLLRRNEEWTVELVVSGEPKPALASTLIETDIVEADADSATAGAEFAAALVAGGLSVVPTPIALLAKGIVGLAVRGGSVSLRR